MGLTSTLGWTRAKRASWASFVKVLGTPRSGQDCVCAPAETRNLPHGPSSTLRVALPFCTGLYFCTLAHRKQGAEVFLALSALPR